MDADPARVALANLQARRLEISQTEGYARLTNTLQSVVLERSTVKPVLNSYSLSEAAVSVPHDSAFTSLCLPEGSAVGDIYSRKKKDRKKDKIGITSSSEPQSSEPQPTIVRAKQVPSPQIPTSTSQILTSPQKQQPGMQQQGTGSQIGLQSSPVQSNLLNIQAGQPEITNTDALDLSDLTAFINRPIIQNYTLQCFLLRTSSLFPRYEMWMEKENMMLLAAKKSGTSAFIISTIASDISKTSSHYQGKLKLPVIGKGYSLFSKGRNPKTLSDVEKENKNFESNVREELAQITFPSDESGLRAISLVIPKVNDDYTHIPCRPLKKGQVLYMIRGLDVIKTKPGLFFQFISRKAIKDPNTGRYQMDFGGRAKVASIKNHQLIFGNNPELSKMEAPTILQFGKMEKNKFNIDIRFPLTPLQGFGIALSIFDAK